MPEIEIGDTIADMLEKRNFQTEGRNIVLVRHTIREERKLPQPLSSRSVAFISRCADNFEQWQRVQRHNKGGAKIIDCDYVVAFCGVKDAGMNARFAGVFHNINKSPPPLNIDEDLSAELASIYHGKEQFEIERDGSPRERVFLNLIKEPRFTDLEGHVVVDWYGHHHDWVQEFSADKPNRVLEITSRFYAPFEEWR